jgi:site-specific DNA recombinase
MTTHSRVIRCAIYTRKSSEEGLEQSFNSLHAQREACEAYIASQRQEGWKVLPALYDDGGFSGGTMERPALKQLLEDVNNGRLDTIVVYKVDRLTRSLTDFAKIIETLDARNVSFVSVTQQFSTTTSMGRLTLNVLLSFAQFEREVTGERIRDKIAASKKKGMWMGGLVPLGYDLEQRKLVPNRKEAQLVSRIFHLYLELGCVSRVKQQLDLEGIRSKYWVSRTGSKYGGNRFSRGALYDLLRNRLYIGEIRHRKIWYPGQHAAIIPRELWDRVQSQLSTNSQARANGREGRSKSLLVGLLHDSDGNRFTPSHTVKNGRRYRYYVCQSVIRDPAVRTKGPTRLPAHEIEQKVTARLCAFLRSDKDVFDQLRMPDDDAALIQGLVRASQDLSQRSNTMTPAALRPVLATIVRRVFVRESSIELVLSRASLRAFLMGKTKVSPAGETHQQNPIDLIHLALETKLRRCGMEVRFVVPPDSVIATPRQPKPSLVNALARAHEWYGWVVDGEVSGATAIAHRTGLNDRYVSKVFRCAFLAPDIVEAIVEGRQPEDLTFEKLWRNLPSSWSEQRRILGFPCSRH